MNRHLVDYLRGQLDSISKALYTERERYEQLPITDSNVSEYLYLALQGIAHTKEQLEMALVLTKTS
jgi:hypothetical protein